MFCYENAKGKKILENQHILHYFCLLWVRLELWVRVRGVGGVRAVGSIFSLQTNDRRQQQTKERLERRNILPSLFLLKKIYKQK